jgi:hypothetical protein
MGKKWPDIFIHYSKGDGAFSTFSSNKYNKDIHPSWSIWQSFFNYFGRRKSRPYKSPEKERLVAGRECGQQVLCWPSSIEIYDYYGHNRLASQRDELGTDVQLPREAPNL